MKEILQEQGIIPGTPQFDRLISLHGRVLAIANTNGYSQHRKAVSIRIITALAYRHLDELVALDTARNTLATQRIMQHIEGLSPEAKNGLRLFAEDHARKIYGDTITEDHVDASIGTLLGGSRLVADIVREYSMREEVILRDEATRLHPDAQVIAAMVLDDMFPRE